MSKKLLSTRVNYFKFSELIKTDTGLSNYPNTPEQGYNLVNLWYFLNRIRFRLRSYIIVNSCFRTVDVNNAVGGVPNSYHTKGRAADIYTSPDKMDELFELLKAENPVELIRYKTFIHFAI